MAVLLAHLNATTINISVALLAFRYSDRRSLLCHFPAASPEGDERVAPAIRTTHTEFCFLPLRVAGLLNRGQGTNGLSLQRSLYDG